MDLEENSLGKSVKVYVLRPLRVQTDLELFLDKASRKIKKTLRSEKRRIPAFKFQLNVHIQLKKYIYDVDQEGEEKVIYLDPFFNSTSFSYLSSCVN